MKMKMVAAVLSGALLVSGNAVASQQKPTAKQADKFLATPAGKVTVVGAAFAVGYVIKNKVFGGSKASQHDDKRHADQQEVSRVRALTSKLNLNNPKTRKAIEDAAINDIVAELAEVETQKAGVIDRLRKEEEARRAEKNALATKELDVRKAALEKELAALRYQSSSDSADRERKSN